MKSLLIVFGWLLLRKTSVPVASCVPVFTISRKDAMRKLLTFLKTQNPCRRGQGLAGGWLEARGFTRCQAKNPSNGSAVPSFVQARFLSIVRALCTSLALGAVAFGVCSPTSAQIIGGGVWGDVKPRAAPAGVVLTHQTTTVGSVSGAVASFGTITINPNGGVTGANRRVIVVVEIDSGSPTNLPIPASVVFTPNSGAPITADTVSVAGQDTVTSEVSVLFSAVLPVGTTTTLTATFGASLFNSPRFSVYTVDNSTLSNPTTPVVTFVQGTTTPPITGTINTLSGGALLGMFVGFGTSTNAWSAGITTSDGAFGSNNWGSLSNTAANTPLTVSNTWTVSGSANPDLALWAYR
jgi:hypothetical protein